jgi:hypothetical protein
MLNEKKQKALQHRAVDAYSDFEKVHELVSYAYAEYEEKGDLKKCLKKLASEISVLAKSL